MQAKFATQFLKRIRQWGIKTAIETAGDAPAKRLLPLAQQCNEVLFDLKIMDEKQSQDIFNINLVRVLDNLRLLVAEGITVIPRLPLIPGYTLSEENVQRVLAILAPLNLIELHLLPFHQYGEPKYRLLGQAWAMKEVATPVPAAINQLKLLVEASGYRVTIGG